jgi:glycosyltransferase involved in cell wall biosynthesis
MRIALAALSCDNATGIGRIVRSLAREFTVAGHDVTVVAQRIDQPPPDFHSIKFSPIPFSGALGRLSYNVQTRLLFGRRSFDVVNGFGVGRGATVVTAQSCHAAGVEIQRTARRGRVGRHGLGLFDAVALRDERILTTAPPAKLVIAVSSLVKTQLLHHYGLKPARVTVIPNGVDLEHFTPATDSGTRESRRKELGFEGSDFGLLFVGNEFDRKGLQTILEAMGLGRDAGMKLAVAGSDDPAPYRALARKLGVSDRVRFLGPVKGPEDILAGADALVLPAWYEPFGMVIIEAMAAGVPVVASADAGALEGLQHETHALFLHDPRNADELAEHLRRLKGDDLLRKRLGAAGRETARRFSWKEIARQTLEAYRTVARTAGALS